MTSLPNTCFGIDSKNLLYCYTSSNNETIITEEEDTSIYHYYYRCSDNAINKNDKGDNGGKNECTENNARRIWCETKDPAAVLKVLPQNGWHREKLILKGLKRYGTQDPLAVLRCLPYHIRCFYIHAYQSYVWNIVSTERIQRFGTKTTKGDLYCENIASTSSNSETLATTEDESTAHNKVSVVLMEPSKIPFTSVVLPLPGSGVLYPDNEIGRLYRDILKKDGIEFRKNAPPEATAKGSYRFLHADAHNLEWEIVSHGDQETIIDAVKFKFELDSGCYATVMLRELLKISE